MFADYEDYIKCQEKVSALYKVSMSTEGKLTSKLELAACHPELLKMCVHNLSTISGKRFSLLFLLQCHRQWDLVVHCLYLFLSIIISAVNGA